MRSFPSGRRSWRLWLPALAAGAGAAFGRAIAQAPAADTSKPPPAAFEVRGFEVEGNTLLPKRVVDEALKSAAGPGVTLARIRQALTELQAAYRQRGWVTVAVALPPQKITNGVVKVRVTEARLSDVTIVGNRHYSEENIRRALPGVSTNVLLNTGWFDPELDRANANPDRQIYPVLSPGPLPDTSALQLKVKDRLPLHGHVQINDQATPGTPLLRADAALQYNNLWQRDHQVGIDYNFSPTDLKFDAPEPAGPFDGPRVASTSGFYRIPFPASVDRSATNSNDTAFGYDPVQRAFRLPPATAGSELVFIGSHFTSETPVLLSAPSLITNGVSSTNSIYKLSSQVASRSVTGSDDLGLRFNTPLPAFLGVESGLSLGGDFKAYSTRGAVTKYTTLNLYGLDNEGNATLLKTSVVTNVAAPTLASVQYGALTAGWSGKESDRWGGTSASVTANLFPAALGSGRAAFASLTGNPGTGGTAADVNVNITREQRLTGEWSLLGRAAAQWAATPLLGNEQFVMGGMGGVRGYRDGEDYGDAGWKVQLDLRTPPWRQGYFPTTSGEAPIYFRFAFFGDAGQRYLLEPEAGQQASRWMAGSGLSCLINIGQNVEGRLVVARTIVDGPVSAAGTFRAYFNVTYQF